MGDELLKLNDTIVLTEIWFPCKVISSEEKLMKDRVKKRDWLLCGTLLFMISCGPQEEFRVEKNTEAQHFLQKTDAPFTIKSPIFYNEGRIWRPGYLTCDLPRYAAFVFYNTITVDQFINRQMGNMTNQREDPLNLVILDKNGPKRMNPIPQTSDFNCGMGKCDSEFSDRFSRYLVRRVNYTSYDQSPDIFFGSIKGFGGNPTNPYFNGSCHQFVHTKIVCFTPKRSIFISEPNQDKLEYRSFDFSDAGKSNNPSLYLTNGVEDHAMAGRVTYQFQNNGYQYSVSTTGYYFTDSIPHARLVVTYKNNVIMEEQCFAYTMPQIQYFSK